MCYLMILKTAPQVQTGGQGAEEERDVSVRRRKKKESTVTEEL